MIPDEYSINVTLAAKEKAYRLFSVPVLKERLRRGDGKLFWDDYQENYHLRTRATDKSGAIWVIVFVVEGDEVVIIAQTHEHFGYGEERFSYVSDPDFG